MCSNVSLFVKYVCCVYSLVEKWWLNVCGCGLSRTNKELLWLWQSDGQMRRLWSNHVKPDLLSAVESAFSEGQQVNVWSFVDVTPVFTKEFLRHTQTQTHTLLGENERCVCQSNANPAGFFLQVTADVWLTPVRPYLSWWQSLTTLHGENASRRQTRRLTLDISVKVPVIVAGSLVLLCVSSSSCPALLSCYCYSSCFRISYMSFGCFLSYFEGLFSYTCCSLFLDVGFWSILL